jgi:hypothetical protein
MTIARSSVTAQLKSQSRRSDGCFALLTRVSRVIRLSAMIVRSDDHLRVVERVSKREEPTRLTFMQIDVPWTRNGATLS